MSSSVKPNAGECTAVCAACGGRITVQPLAGIPPYVNHDGECPREGWTPREAAAYDDGTTATIRNWGRDDA